MPGLYDRNDDLSAEINRKKMTYNFKSVDRTNITGVATNMEDQVILRGSSFNCICCVKELPIVLPVT